MQLRLHFGRACIALSDCDVDTAAAHCTAFEELELHVQNRAGEQRFPTVATPVALERWNAAEARRLLDRLRSTFDENTIVDRLLVPAFQAWLASERDARPNFGRPKVNLAAARCRLARG
jgi:hypothetical protein